MGAVLQHVDLTIQLRGVEAREELADSTRTSSSVISICPICARTGGTERAT